MFRLLVSLLVVFKEDDVIKFTEIIKNDTELIKNVKLGAHRIFWA